MKIQTTRERLVALQQHAGECEKTAGRLFLHVTGEVTCDVFHGEMIFGREGIASDPHFDALSILEPGREKSEPPHEPVAPDPPPADPTPEPPPEPPPEDPPPASDKPQGGGSRRKKKR